MGLVSELRRRNVLRMAVLYVVATWLIMQVAEVIIGLANLPEWIGPTILVLLAVGFPIALIFSWFYELTAEGISLEKDVAAAESITHVTGRRLDFLVISLLCAGLILFAYDKWWIGPPPEKSIAVLAFENMNADPEQEYFSDGISEELLNLLARVPELTVISRSSSFSFKGKDIAIPTVAEQLNVTHVLDGSVRKEGDRVRITAQLIEARSDSHLWSETYDRTLGDIFAIQDEIAAKVVEQLKVFLGAGEQETMFYGRRPTENLEAYEHYLRGRYFWQRRGEENIRRAISLFEQGTELDPQFARAWSSLAAAQWTLPAYSALPMDKAQPEALSAARKALMLDDSLAEAHAVLGDIARANRKWSKAEEHFLRAIASEPKNSTAHLWYGQHLGDVGHSRDALEESLIAYRLDPMNAGTNMTLAAIYWALDDTDNAVKYGMAGWELGLDSGFAAGLRIKALANLRLGEYERAIEFAQQYDEQRVNPFNYPATFLRLFVEAKIDAENRPMFFQTLAEHEAVLHFIFLLPGYVDFGRIDDAYRVVNTGLDRFTDQFRWVLWNPDMATFRQDPRFADLVTELGLLDYWWEYGWPDMCQPAGDSLNCK